MRSPPFAIFLLGIPFWLVSLGLSARLVADLSRSLAYFDQFDGSRSPYSYSYSYRRTSTTSPWYTYSSRPLTFSARTTTTAATAATRTFNPFSNVGSATSGFASASARSSAIFSLGSSTATLAGLKRMNQVGPTPAARSVLTPMSPVSRRELASPPIKRDLLDTFAGWSTAFSAMLAMFAIMLVCDVLLISLAVTYSVVHHRRSQAGTNITAALSKGTLIATGVVTFFLFAAGLSVFAMLGVWLGFSGSYLGATLAFWILSLVFCIAACHALATDWRLARSEGHANDGANKEES